ncbi:MAG: cohesin domain-containing protein [Candidatus Competibacterales bacterium]
MNAIAQTCVLATTLGLGLVAQGAMIDIDPANTTVTEGENFDVDINVADLGDGVAPSLGAFDLTLAFTNNLAFVSAAFGDQLSPSVSTTTPGANSVNFTEVSLLDAITLDLAQAASFTLLTATFQALAPGVAGIDFAGVNDLLVDAAGDALADVDFTGASVTVEMADPGQVPLPSTLLLLALAPLVRFARP